MGRFVSNLFCWENLAEEIRFFERSGADLDIGSLSIWFLGRCQVTGEGMCNLLSHLMTLYKDNDAKSTSLLLSFL